MKGIEQLIGGNGAAVEFPPEKLRVRLTMAYDKREIVTASGRWVLESGIPLPLQREYTPRPELPLDQMRVGESVWIECGPWTAMNVQQAKRKAAKGKFVSRQETQGERLGLRVWRTG